MHKNFEFIKKELRYGGSGEYEIWATGQVASCDYAGLIFAYGYYALASLFAFCISLIIFYFLGQFLNDKASLNQHSTEFNIFRSIGYGILYFLRFIFVDIPCFIWYKLIKDSSLYREIKREIARITSHK